MSQFTGYIYKITNKVNNNCYIGQTKTSINKRFISHKCESKRERYNTPLYRAMKKYGVDKFVISELEKITNESKEELSEMLNDLEIDYIEKLKPAYNAAPGGLGSTGVPWTEERKEKFKKLMSGENNPNFGKPLSEETKQKLSESLKGRVISEETRKKTSQTMKGVPKNEETRKKMKEAANKRTNKPPTGKDHHNAKSVNQFDLEGNFIKTFESIHQAANELSIQVNGICLCCKGRLKKSGGYIWKYNDDDNRRGEENLERK